MDNSTSYEKAIARDLHTLCKQNFEWATAMYDKSSPDHYVNEHQIGDELYETIVMHNEKTEQIMLLERCVGKESTSTFPYRLLEQMVGIDAETGEPCDVWQDYLLDTKGSFHKNIRQDDRTIIALCGPDQQARLTSFFINANVGQFMQAAQHAG